MLLSLLLTKDFKIFPTFCKNRETTQKPLSHTVVFSPITQQPYTRYAKHAHIGAVQPQLYKL